MKTFVCVCLLVAATRVLAADDVLDLADNALTNSFWHDQIRTRISGLLDLEYYQYPQPPPGLIRASGHDLFAPRLSLFLDAKAGSAIYVFAQTRIDTGFDPSDLGVEWRLDEYAVRVTPWSDGRFSFQIGKFSTVVGSWVERHLSWENPLINAPLPYENPTLVSDMYVPVTAESFRAVPGAYKYAFLPIIWGPVYAIGASVSGRIGIFEYAAEVKNVPLASRPESWYDCNFSHPAVDAKLALDPNEAWHLGISMGEGSYLRPNAYPLPYQADFAEYRQYLLGQEVSYARGHLQIWAEAFESRFQIPELGNTNVFAYYVETKYKFTPQLFGALRWNQEFFASDTDPMGQPIAHGHDVSRIDTAVGYRFTAHTQLKVQYSLARGNFVSNKVNGTFAAQFTVRF